MSHEKGPHEKMAEKVFGIAKPDGSYQTVGDEGAILGYLACIARHGDPGMDMGHWSDFVNRVRRLAAQAPSLLSENCSLRKENQMLSEALEDIAGQHEYESDGWMREVAKDALKSRVALSAPKQPKGRKQ